VGDPIADDSVGQSRDASGQTDGSQ